MVQQGILFKIMSSPTGEVPQHQRISQIKNNCFQVLLCSYGKVARSSLVFWEGSATHRNSWCCRRPQATIIAYHQVNCTFICQLFFRFGVQIFFYLLLTRSGLVHSSKLFSVLVRSLIRQSTSRRIASILQRLRSFARASIIRFLFSSYIFNKFCNCLFLHSNGFVLPLLNVLCAFWTICKFHDYFSNI